MLMHFLDILQSRHAGFSIIILVFHTVISILFRVEEGSEIWCRNWTFVSFYFAEEYARQKAGSARNIPVFEVFWQTGYPGWRIVQNNIVNEMPVDQILLPSCYRKEVIQSLHDLMCHMGRDCTIHLVGERFFWPCMSSHVSNHISSCRWYIQNKKPESQAPLVPIKTSHPRLLVLII